MAPRSLVSLATPARCGRPRHAAEHAILAATTGRIGSELGADGLFLGTVVDFTEVRTGGAPSPEVTLQLRLVESASGLTAWESSQGRRGPNVRSRLFGFGGDSLTEVARHLIRDQLRTLVE